MRAARRSALVLLGLLVAGLWFYRFSETPGHVHGRVRDRHGPVAGATVHLQGKSPTVLSDAEGRFHLAAGTANLPVVAWKAGYRIAAGSPRDRFVNLFLAPLPAQDNENYAWVDPHPDKNQAHNCGNCHTGIYDEWRRSSHARSAGNPRFLSLYAGPAQSWNLRKEHPLGSGVCAACHAPTFTDSTLDYDLTKVTGVAARGVHCDYCHKIADALTDRLGTRFGRDGLSLLRPPGQEQFFFGPLDDAVRPGESFAYSPLYKESRYCASCHEGVVFGVHVYGTYSEWLESPAPAKGQQCQTCHMTPTGKMTNIAPGKGGIERKPHTLASHSLPGSQAEMLRRCLKMKVSKAGAQVVVEVLADNVGHRVPTGFIDRNLVLVAEATSQDGTPLKLIKGPRLPASAGKKLAGSPGLLFAKQLHDPDGRNPIPFWLPHGKTVDTRLRPGRAERAEFTFASAATTVRVRLIYRRFWQDVAEVRGWSDNEVVVVDECSREED
jgi:hypothetical protein